MKLRSRTAATDRVISYRRSVTDLTAKWALVNAASPEGSRGPGRIPRSAELGVFEIAAFTARLYRSMTR